MAERAVLGGRVGLEARGSGCMWFWIRLGRYEFRVVDMYIS